MFIIKKLLSKCPARNVQKECLSIEHIEIGDPFTNGGTLYQSYTKLAQNIMKYINFDNCAPSITLNFFLGVFPGGSYAKVER